MIIRNSHLKQPIQIDHLTAAELARIAGAEIELEHGLTYRKQPINEHAVGWFLAGAYGIDVGTEQDGRRILASAQGLAAIAECEATADRAAALLAEIAASPIGGMIDQAKMLRMQLRELLGA